MPHLNRFSTNYEPFSTSRNQVNTDIPPRSPHDVTFVRHFNMEVSMIQALYFVNGSLVVIGQGSTTVTTSPFGDSSDTEIYNAFQSSDTFCMSAFFYVRGKFKCFFFDNVNKLV